MAKLTFVNNGLTQPSPGDIFRSSGQNWGVVLAQADTSAHSSGLLGSWIDAPLPGGSGTGQTDSIIEVNCTESVTPGDRLYLSAATAGKATKTAPSYPVFLGTVLSARVVSGVYKATIEFAGDATSADTSNNASLNSLVPNTTALNDLASKQTSLDALAAAGTYVDGTLKSLGVGRTADVACLTTGGTVYGTQIRMMGGTGSAAMPAPFDLLYYTSTFSGGIDPVMIQGFNIGHAVANYCEYTENWELNYIDGGPPLGTIERHSNYKSKDGNTAYRPWTWDLNMNTHKNRWLFDGIDTWGLRNLAGNLALSYTADTGNLVIPGTCSAATFYSGSMKANGTYCLADIGGSAVSAGLIAADGVGGAFPSKLSLYSYSAADTPVETLTVYSSKVGIGTAAPDTTLTIYGTYGGSTLKPAGIRMTGAGSCIGWSIEDPTKTGDHRSWAVMSGYNEWGVLSFVAGADAASAPGVLILKLDGKTAGVVIPSLAGTGSRTVVADANGRLSAP